MEQSLPHGMGSGGFWGDHYLNDGEGCSVEGKPDADHQGKAGGVRAVVAHPLFPLAVDQDDLSAHCRVAV